MIERDSKLVDQYMANRRRLEHLGTKSKDIRVINQAFSLDASQNSEETKTALDNADVFVCYPWPEEVVDRLELFNQHAKKGSVIVMYGGPMDDFRLSNKSIKRMGLEVIGKEMNAQLKKQGDRADLHIRGFDTPSFGANWVVLKKTT